MAHNIIRDFTDEKKEELKSQISELESEKQGFFGGVGDWFSDQFNNIKGVKIDDYLNNISGYHRLIMDTKNTTLSQLNEIFTNVNQTDIKYCSSLNTIYDQLACYKKTALGLANLIQPNASSSVSPFCAPGFWDGLNAIGHGAADYYLGLYMTTAPDGRTTYNWDNIREILQREPSEISACEYAALVAVINSMTRVDANGNIVVDTVAMEKFIACGYTCEMESHIAYDYVSFGEYGGTTVPNMQLSNIEYKYTATPTFQAVCALYELYVDRLVCQNGEQFFNGSEPDEKKAYVNSEIFKSTILMEMAVNGSVITQYQPMMSFDENNIKSLSINISRNNSLGCYTVTANGFINDYMGDGITIYDFDIYNTYSLLNNVDSLASALYQNKGEEFLKALGEEFVGQVIDKIEDLAPTWVGIVTDATMFAAETGIRNIEIDINNEKIDEILRDTYLIRAFESLHIGASLSEYNNTLSIHHAYVDERNLQIDVYSYIDKTGNSISIQSLERDLQIYLETGNISDSLKDYVNWYGAIGSASARVTYRDNLERELIKYCWSQNDMRLLTLNDLNLRQIEELNKALKNPGYIPDSEIMP